MKSFVLLLACIFLGALAACGGKPKETPGPTAAGGASVPAAPAPRPPGVEAHLAKYAMGYDVGPSGGVATAGATFGKGEKAFVSFAIVDAKPKSQARVVWAAKSGGATVFEETKPLPEDGGVVSFAADTKAWAIGDYALQVFVVEPGEPGPRQLGGSDLSVKATRSK
ncbi:MAG: hypothetical protein ACHQPI_00240 [Thermoanaerobaculia bacterium]